MSKVHKALFKELITITKQKNLIKGKIIHANIITTNSIKNLYLTNNIINLYAKCGEIKKAKLAFEQIPNKDEVSWSSIINAYVQKGGSQFSLMAIELFGRMRCEGCCFPSAHALVGVLGAAARVGDVKVGREVHCVGVKSGKWKDVVVGSAIVDMYCKVGFVWDAWRVFEELPVRNSFTWAIMASGFCRSGMVGEVLKVFKAVVGEGGEGGEDRGCVHLLTSVVSSVSRVEFVECGRGVHCFAVKVGVVDVGEVKNCLITMYLKCGCVVDAVRVFEMCEDKNPVMWSAMVTGLAQSGENQRALEVFSEMHFSGARPSEFTFVGVINACGDSRAIEEGKQVHSYSVKMGFENQVFVGTALVNMYANCGSTADARQGFAFLKEPDVVLWTSMVVGYVNNGDNEEALSLYGKMMAKDIQPNDLTISSALKGCSSLAALEQGKQIHSHAIKYGLSGKVAIGSALSTMYAKCGCVDEGNEVFRRMTERDVISWNAMISGLAQNGFSDKALDLFEEMRKAGVKPDHVTFVNILSACSHNGLVERAQGYFCMMSKDFSIVPRLEHYACMVDVYSRAGRLTEAKDFIESATLDHGMCLWRNLLGACHNHRQYELGTYAGEKLMELGSKESSAYMLLSRMYAVLGKSDDAERVMKLMKLRNVGKEPGCSWIELQNLVHVFLVRDSKHPEIENVNSWLRILTKQMMHEGYQPAYDSSLTASNLDWELV